MTSGESGTHDQIQVTMRAPYGAGTYRARGFTIVELLIVVVVIAILAAITIIAYNGISNRAKASATASTVLQAAKRLELIRTENAGVYPSTLPGDIVAPAANTLIYVPNYDNGGDSFCLAAVSGESVVSITNSSGGVRAGVGCAPRDGLVAWWPFAGNANDLSGSGMTGTPNNATLSTGQGGAPNSAYYFSGGTSYIGLASSAPLNLTANNVTVSAWIRLDALPAAAAWYDVLSSTGSNDWSIGINATPAGVGRLMWTRTTAYDSPGSSTVSQGEWVHVTAVLVYGNPGAVRYYINGELSQSATWSNPTAFAPSTKRIGARSNGGYFRGTIDDLRVYARALNDAEIASLGRAPSQ